MDRWTVAAKRTIQRCREIACFSEERGRTTRTYLSPPMHDVHRAIAAWCESAGCAVAIDAAGNLRATVGPSASSRLVIASHLDTVPDAGAFDGVLGVIIGVTLLEELDHRELPFAIEIMGFSEEEGVRFGTPFIGSRAVIGDLDTALIATIEPAIRAFGLDQARLPDARLSSDVMGYIEFHIEQGPTLEHLDLPLGIVDAIVGQTRLLVRFDGHANHAGTTPMALRKDALAGAAEWIHFVEHYAKKTSGLVATVGQLHVEPGATNIVPGAVQASLDVRHADDEIRRQSVARMMATAEEIALRRRLEFSYELRLDQSAVIMDPDLSQLLEQAVGAAGYPVHHLASGAGHDAMIMARRFPSAMLFLRTPGGLSHHPDETVMLEDVAAALKVGHRFLESLGSRNA